MAGLLFFERVPYGRVSDMSVLISQAGFLYCLSNKRFDSVPTLIRNDSHNYRNKQYRSTYCISVDLRNLSAF